MSKLEICHLSLDILLGELGIRWIIIYA